MPGTDTGKMMDLAGSRFFLKGTFSVTSEARHQLRVRREKVT